MRANNEYTYQLTYKHLTSEARCPCFQAAIAASAELFLSLTERRRDARVAALTSMTAECRSGHRLPVCCQTLALCDTVPYRRCEQCGAFAVANTETETGELGGRRGGAV